MENIHNDFNFPATTVEEAAVALNSDVLQGLTTNQVKEHLQQ